MNLQGKAENPLVLTGDEMHEVEFINHHTANSHMMAVRNFHLVKMVLLYVFGELEAADQGRRVWEKGQAEGTHFMMYFASLFSGLTSLGLARRHPGKQWKHVARAKRHIKKMEGLVKDGAVNATLVLRFLQAEKLALKGDLVLTRKAYDETIQVAGRTGSRLIKALVLERTGEFLLQRKEPIRAVDYFRQAVTEVCFREPLSKLLHFRCRLLTPCFLADK